MTKSNLDLARECGAYIYRAGTDVVFVFDTHDQLDAFAELIRAEAAQPANHFAGAGKPMPDDGAVMQQEFEDAIITLVLCWYDSQETDSPQEVSVLRYHIRQVIAADRSQRQGDAAMPIIAYLRSTPEGAPIWSEDCVCEDPVFPADPEGSDSDDISMPMVRQSDAQAALAAKDVQIEGLRSVTMELQRLMLVIESSVRNWDPANHAAVMVLITANNAAIDQEAAK